MIERLRLENFTAFRKLDIAFAPGVNLIIGDNGTGKTHLLKLLYAALTAPRKRLSSKIVDVFLPAEGRLGRLVTRMGKSATAKGHITRNGRALSFSFSNHAKESLRSTYRWDDEVKPAAYIPVKEMLANAPGFRSLYASREIHFEAVYADIIDRAYLPRLKGAPDRRRKKLLTTLQRAIDGKVIVKGETFYLKNAAGDLEFTLVAEGFRKLALLWLLIQNGTLLDGSTLFWDEPEANINPSVLGTLVEILLDLQAEGVQVFIATHSYAVLKEFELLRTTDHSVRFFSLARDGKTGEVGYGQGESFADIVPNEISDAFRELYDREVARALGSDR